MADDRTILNPPIYLVTGQEECWRCGELQPAVELVGELTASESDEERHLVSLSNVEELPDEVVQLITERHPPFRLHRSKTAGQEYYTNFCQCGANFGDFFLHSEPGHAFFPLDEEDARLMTVEELPITDPIEVHASFGAGTEELIVAYARRIG